MKPNRQDVFGRLRLGGSVHARASAWGYIGAFAVIACGPQVSPHGAGFSLPFSFAEGHNEQSGVEAAGAAGAAGVAAASEAKDLGGPPDPAPLVTEHYLRYRFRYSKTKPTLLGVEAFELERPVASVRQLGRFAVELWIGHELVERVRFDFPLMIEDPTSDTERAPFEAGATVEHTLLVPRSLRATRAILVDRSGRRWRLPWPPDRPYEGGLTLTELR